MSLWLATHIDFRVKRKMNLKIFLKFLNLTCIDLTSSVIRQNGKSQNGGNNITKYAKFSEKGTFPSLWSWGKKCSFFRKIWLALFSWHHRFEICLLALLPTIFTSLPNLVMHSGVDPSLYPNCNHQIVIFFFNLILKAG